MSFWSKLGSFLVNLLPAFFAAFFPNRMGKQDRALKELELKNERDMKELELKNEREMREIKLRLQYEAKVLELKNIHTQRMEELSNERFAIEQHHSKQETEPNASPKEGKQKWLFTILPNVLTNQP